jgi:hypothetical protein
MVTYELLEKAAVHLPTAAYIAVVIWLWRDQIHEIVELWNAGYPAEAIISELALPITDRQVRRIGAAHGNWRKRQLARIERHETVDKS